MRIRTLLAGLGMGAGLVYMLDPDRGRRRRALIRDQGLRLVDALGDMSERTGKLSRNLRDRTRGFLIETRKQLEQAPVTDEVLVERVRAKLGHLTSHPRAIVVTANDGEITLRGQILAPEVEPLVAAVRLMVGVGRVQNLLEAYTSAGQIPSLQGEPRRNEQTL